MKHACTADVVTVLMGNEESVAIEKLGAGAKAVFLCLIFAWGSPGSWGIFIVMAAGCLDVILLTYWYGKRVNFHRRPDEEKRKLIVAAWFIHVVVVAVGLAFTSP